MDTIKSIQLGALERKRDNRDIKLEKLNEIGAVYVPVEIPDVFLPEYKIPYYWQRKTPTCGAHAGSYLKTIQENIENGLDNKFSPRFLWRMIKNIDGYSLDIGTDMRSIFKALKSNGICDDVLLPNDTTLSLEEYSTPKLNNEMFDNAQNRIIKSYAFLTDLSFENIKKSIYQNKAVLLLIKVDEGFFNTDTPIFKEKKSGHFVLAWGYNKDYIYIYDSTDNIQIKKINKIYNNFIIEAGTAVDLNNNVIEMLIKQKNLLQMLIELYKKLLSLKVAT